MSALQHLYTSKIRPDLQKELGLTNVHEVPQLKKIILNVGIGTYIARVNSDYSLVEDTLAKVSGQKPTLRKAKISVSNFNKLREGQPNGLVVTLRKENMYTFLEKMIHFVLPRMRDFKGISAKSFDASGNLNIGVRDHTIFPEIVVTDAVKPHGIQVTFVVESKSKDHSKALFDAMGFPFIK